MLKFLRPYTPDLVGWLRDFGQGSANYDANGHFARIQPIFNAYSFDRQPGRRHAHADPAQPAPRRAADRPGAALPGRGLASRRRTARRPSATSTAPWTATRASCSPAHEARPRHRLRPRRRLGAGGLRHRRERRRRDLPRPGDLHERVLGDPGRGRQDRRGQGRQDRVARRHARPQGGGRPAHRSPRLRRLPRRRRVHDPPAVADRRALRRVHADPAAAGERPAGRRSCARSRRGPARASTCCRSRRPPSPSTSTWSTTRCACPTASAWRSSSTSWAPAWPGAAATCARPSSTPTRRSRRPTRSWRSSPARTGCSPTWPATATRSSLRWPATAPQVADFVTQANVVSEATAERSSALEENIAKLPAFLRELTPTMERLGGLADQMTPVLTDLGAEAPSINRFIEELGPFSQAGIPALQSLGAAADVGGPALTKSKPIITDVGQLAAAAKPLTNNLAALLTSLKDTGGIERLMDYLFYQVAAINGFDADGHYLRAGLILNACSQYAIAASPDCLATFDNSGSGSSARAASATTTPGYADTRRSPSLRKLDALLRGQDPGPRRRHSGVGQTPARRPTRAPPPPAAARRRPRDAGRADRRAEPAAGLGQRPGVGAARLPARRRRLMRRGSASIAANPVLDRRGDDARDHRRRLPGLQRQLGPALRPDLRAQDPGPQRGAAWSRATTCASAARAWARSTDITPVTATGRLGQRGAHAQARDVRQAAARRLDRAHPPALRAGPEVRARSPRAPRARATTTARRSRCTTRRRSRSSSTRSSTPSTTRRARPRRATSPSSATASPAADPTSTARSRSSTRC